MKHAELIARFEAAEVGSRELDALIWDIEDDRPRWSFGGGLPIYRRDPDDDDEFDTPPHYTTSLDAGIALAERLGLDTFAIIYAAIMNWKAHDPRGAMLKVLPLTLCIAILRALDDQ